MLTYSVSVPPPCYHSDTLKNPGHSTKSAGGRLHLNTHAPLTQRSQSGLSMTLSRHSVGTYPETSSHATRQGTFGLSSQLAEQLWTDPGIKSEISVCDLISTLKKAQAGNEWSNIFPITLASEEKATTITSLLLDPAVVERRVPLKQSTVKPFLN